MPLSFDVPDPTSGKKKKKKKKLTKKEKKKMKKAGIPIPKSDSEEEMPQIEIDTGLDMPEGYADDDEDVSAAVSADCRMTNSCRCRT